MNAFRPSPNHHESAFSSGSTTSLPSEPRFPKSLYLIRPLFTTYELNPVAPQAQASVPVPDGLDLHAWIVPPPKEQVEEDSEEHGERKGKRSKKGKAKDLGGGKTKSKKRVVAAGGEDDDDGDLVRLSPHVPETEAEKAERERVRICDQTFPVVQPDYHFD